MRQLLLEEAKSISGGCESMSVADTSAAWTGATAALGSFAGPEGTAAGAALGAAGGASFAIGWNIGSAIASALHLC